MASAGLRVSLIFHGVARNPASLLAIRVLKLHGQRWTIFLSKPDDRANLGLLQLKDQHKEAAVAELKGSSTSASRSDGFGMRVLAGCLVVVGLLVAAVSFPEAAARTRNRADAFYDGEIEAARHTLDLVRGEVVGRMIAEGRVPTWVVVSPWPGVFTGLGMAALGIIVLAIRRPARRALEEGVAEDGDRRECPFCAEMIKTDAKVCRYCRRDLPEQKPGPNPNEGSAPSPRSEKELLKEILARFRTENAGRAKLWKPPPWEESRNPSRAHSSRPRSRQKLPESTRFGAVSRAPIRACTKIRELMASGHLWQLERGS